MKCIAWPELMRLGLVDLRLSPEAFWNLTPVELMLMLGAGDAKGTLTRAGFDSLTARFPDKALTHLRSTD